ncbi:receptor-like protein 12 [Carica papaya]|uniref:receptor-like protein 12 n=1 Tax=Carica papaya TaxID=3649 RepID=UPI000B8CF367|nr:receptor-like protein 12 [Carica papaya]
MKFSRQLWLFLLTINAIFLHLNILPICSQLCFEEQQLSLLQLKNNFKFNPASSVKLVNWVQSIDCCRWNGVTCDEDGRVMGLDLSKENIAGVIDNSSSLFDLQYLRSLDLSFNNFNRSQIPSQISKLGNLVYLNLSNAGFGGQIPIEISRLTRLASLDLSNFFLGDSLVLQNPNLTMLVQNLSHLTELYLDGVRISERGKAWCQAISSSLPNLRVLSMSRCNISGPIDPSLLKLRYLSIVRLDNNDLSSSVPDFFGNFSNLISLSLGNCKLSGKLSQRVLELEKLQTLDLSNNKFLQGSVLDFPRNGSLQTLVLSGTNISGKLPESIGNLASLATVDLSGCSFSGSIPSSMANLTRLVHLDLSFNHFSGLIPSFVLSKNLTYIKLSHNMFSGPIPTHWEGFQNLVNLDLRNNMLNGTIPSSLFSLPSLQKIQLSDNQFSGQLHEFPSLPSNLLDTLILSSNKLEGPIPTSIFKLRGLHVLQLSSNKFKGTIQLATIQNLGNLTNLDLSYNNLTVNASGNYSTISSFPQLTTLKLASCSLEVFPDLKKQSKLFSLDLSENKISGSVPSWFWSIGNSSLNEVNLSSNSFTDLEEPYYLPPLSSLDLHSNLLNGRLPKIPSSAAYLDYSSNNFSSVIPAEIGNFLFNSVFFSLSNNSLTGPIPECICKAMYIRVLDFSSNMLSGLIPECLFQMTSLGVLNLRRNVLTGRLPDTFSASCGLQTLDLNANQLEGPVPRSLANCKMLGVFDMGNNRIYDNFPCQLENISSLRVLVLRSNQLHGTIACSGSDKVSWKMLQIVDLASNNFSGTLPPKWFKAWQAMMGNEDHYPLQFEFLHLNKFYYQDSVTVTSKGLELKFEKVLTLLTVIDFSRNKFEGPIPKEMGEFRGVYVLNLSQNVLTGQIPSDLGNMIRLESLDLSGNNLNGEIPTQLTRLNFLSFLDLSNNQLTGRIPIGAQFGTFSAACFEGNKGLCGYPLNVTCRVQEEAKTTEDSEGNDRVGVDLKFTGPLFGFVFGLGIFNLPLVFCKRWRIWYNGRVDRLILSASTSHSRSTRGRRNNARSRQQRWGR